MKHITEPLSAKEIRDALGVTDEDLEAARRAIGGTMSDDRYEYRFVDERDCWFDMEQGRYMSPGDITILLNTHPYFVRRLASLQAENERLNKLLRMYRLKLRVDASKGGE